MMIPESPPQEEIDQIFEVCHDILPGIWRRVKKDDIIISMCSITPCLHYSHLSYLLDPIECSGGVANRVYSCRMNRELASMVTNEPDKVIVRLYGSLILDNIDEPRLMGDDVELLIFHLLSEHGLGPRLLGVFSRGRIEEYIPNIRPSPRELDCRGVDRAMASLFAKIHSLDLPITKKHVFRREIFHKWVKQRVETTEGEFVVQYDERTTAIADEIDAFPYHDELAWLEDTAEKIGSKSVFCHNDGHLYNILFRSEDDDEEENGDCKQEEYDDDNDGSSWARIMVPIDFELSSFNYRGYDLAYYLNFRYYHPCEGETDFESIRFPDEKEIATFLEAYLTHLSNVDPNFDPSIDNMHQLTKEVEFGSLFTHLFLFGWAINDRRFKSASSLEWPKDYPYLRLKRYRNEKEKFMEKYEATDSS